MPPRLPFDALFIIGCPRSGTTWVQLMLSQFPTIATAPETQIFAYYLDHFRRQWRHEHDGPGRAFQGRAGLSRLLSEDDFEELCRRSASMVMDKIAAGKPGAEIVCEKSPKHALQAEFIQRIFPDAYFLHVVRDPRDTVASLLAAGRSWGKGWAPKNAIDAARMWVQHVQHARRVRGRTDRFIEVRYEDLVVDAAAQVERIFSWLGVPQPAEACRRSAEHCRIALLRATAGGPDSPIPGERSPRGFFGPGKVGSWSERLSRTEARIVEYLCAPELNALGYEATPPRRIPSRVVLHDTIQRLRESIDWQLERLLRQV